VLQTDIELAPRRGAAVPAPSHPAEQQPGGSPVGAGAILAVLAGALVLAAAWHLTQGTSGVGLAELARLVTGDDAAVADATRDVLFGSRIPRLAAAVTVGFALGVAGALFQSLARNAIASPDTLAVTGGAYFAITVVAAFGLSVPLWASGAVAFVGGLGAAAVVLALGGAGGTSTTRLVLAGSAVALALQSGTAALLILFAEETTSLFAWGSGSLSQLSLESFRQAAPLVGGATLCGILLARRLDLLALGDDTASVLGVPVRSTRVAGTVLAALLTAAAVTLAGPIGFVGLFAPVLARMLARVNPAILRHAVLLPAAGLVGALSVVLADAVVRALLGPDEAISVPTGVTTTIVGSLFIIVLARRIRDAGPTREPPGASVAVRSRRHFLLVVVLGAAAVAATLVVGLLAGHTWLRTGDLGVWLGGDAPPLVRFALDERSPRVVAALVAGAALALSGSLVQATCRNPLAEPGLLGITGGAGLAAVIGVTRGGVGTEGLLALAVIGALVAFAAVYLLSWRGGLQSDRLVLVGIGVWYGTTALSTYFLIRSNPWDTPRIFTWLSGTTYGRAWDEVLPVAILLLAALPFAFAVRRDLDLLALDDDAPRLAGIRLERVRLAVLSLAALLAATSVLAVGVVAFVGLVAPHAARALVGAHHARIIPVAVLLGAVLLGVADTVGRTVIAPAQLPAGLVVALLGAPYFVFLLARSRA
jgi:ABC-type Fe3+-siderophore transport system permease subunit